MKDFKIIIKRICMIFLSIASIFILIYVIPYYCIYGKKLSKSYQLESIKNREIHVKEYSLESTYSIRIFNEDNQTSKSNLDITVFVCIGNSSSYSNMGIVYFSAYENYEDKSTCLIQGDYSIFDSNKAMYLSKTNRNTIDSITRDDFIDNILKFDLDYSNASFKSVTDGYLFYDHISPVKSFIDFKKDYKTDLSFGLLNLNYKVSDISVFKYDSIEDGDDPYKNNYMLNIEAISEDGKRIEITNFSSICSDSSIKSYIEESRFDLLKQLL